MCGEPAEANSGVDVIAQDGPNELLSLSGNPQYRLEGGTVGEVERDPPSPQSAEAHHHCRYATL
jgi:hypothetical protein